MIVGILATWRLAQLLHDEDGPWQIFARLRDVAGVRYDEWSRPYSDKQVGKMLSCFWCTSIWAALFVTKGKVRETLAYSAGAILLERIYEQVERLRE